MPAPRVRRSDASLSLLLTMYETIITMKNITVMTVSSMRTSMGTWVRKLRCRSLSMRFFTPDAVTAEPGMAETIESRNSAIRRSASATGHRAILSLSRRTNQLGFTSEPG